MYTVISSAVLNSSKFLHVFFKFCQNFHEHFFCRFPEFKKYPQLSTKQNMSVFDYFITLVNILSFQSFHVTIGTGKEWRVVCYGSYSDIYILDALSLEVFNMYTFKSCNKIIHLYMKI